MLGYLYILIAIISWGLWGFLGKIATKYNSGIAVTALSHLVFPTASIILFIVMKFTKETISWSTVGIWSIVLSGMVATLGTVFFYFALAKSPASVVVTLTSVYPAITVILAIVFLKETLNLFQSVGFVLIIIGIIFMSK